MDKFFQRRTIKTALSFLLVFTLLISSVPFSFAATDTKGHWAEKSIQALEKNGVITGYTDGTYKPERAVTRAEFVSILNRLTGISPVTESTSFTDVEMNAWYAGHVAAAVKKGYITGYPDHTFKPNHSISREEAATMMAKLLELQKGGANQLASFSDASTIGSWASDGVAAVIQEGIFGGYPDRSFRPARSITRAETAVIAERALPIVENNRLVTQMNQGADVSGNVTLSKDGATAGPEGKSAVVSGNVTIKGENVTLRNVTIKGDLTIDKAVDQDFTAQNVTVEGKTYVLGGAPTTVRFIDSFLADILMNKENVRLSLEGSTSVSGSILIQVAVHLEINTTGKITRVEVLVDGVTISGTGTIEELVKGANIQLQVTVRVQKTTTTGQATNPPAGGGAGGGGGGGGGTPPQEPPVWDQSLQVSLLDSYNSGAGLDKGGSEIVAFDPGTKRIFSTNSDKKAIDILTIGQNGSLSVVKSVYVSQLGIDGFTPDGITSVAVNPKGGYVAAAVPSDPKTNEGRVFFLTTDGSVITSVYVGALPDMLTFTPDGSRVLVANEGEPNDEYSIDPKGSVSIIDVPASVSGDVYDLLKQEITQTDVTTLTFETPNFAGSFVKDGSIRVYGPGADLAKDLEPEYIATDGRMAYVSLQENNAIAFLDLNVKKYTAIRSLGVKDHSLPGNGLDASNKDGKINIKRWPVLGLYLPDGIALYQKGGKSYLLTANEGDARDYNAFQEEAEVGDLAIKLNASYYKGFTQAELDKMVNGGLFSDEQLGKLNVTTTLGKNADGKYEALYSFGARSFSVWDLGTVTADAYLGQVYDSGDDFEQIIAERFPAYFNTDNAENKFDDRSDNKGPEPEYVTVGNINGIDYAFVGLERMGGVMVYNMEDPAHPRFETYFTSRDFSQGTAGEAAGDLGPEGLTFVAAEDSPTGKPLLISGNETSGTVAVYEITSIETSRLTLMHTNDTHGHLENAARRATLVKNMERQNPNALLVDAGDVFTGTLYFTKYQGEADATLMNMMGYDMMTFGNHEFDKGSATLAQFIQKAGFPLVSSNVSLTGDASLGVLSAAGGTARNGKIQPYVVKAINGVKVGLIGLTTEDTAELSSPSKETAFHNAEETARQMVETLTSQGVKEIVLLSHLGANADRELAKKVEGIDIIVGGHSHTTIQWPEIVKASDADKTPTLILQTGANGANLGYLDARFDKEGTLIPDLTLGKLLPVDTAVQEDVAVKEKLDQYNAELDSFKNTIVGNAPTSLDGARDNVRSKETNLGNLIADGMIWKANAIGKKADIAIQNGGGIRASIDEGEITLGEILTVMPFGNTLAVGDLTGAQVWQALENGVSDVENGAGRFPQVGNLRFSYDPTRPAGQRVYKVEVKGEDGKYTDIDLTKTYRIATNNYMVGGGDGYDVFNDASYREDLYFVDYQVFLDYLQYLNENKLPIPGVEGRINTGEYPTP